MLISISRFIIGVTPNYIFFRFSLFLIYIIEVALFFYCLLLFANKTDEITLQLNCLLVNFCFHFRLLFVGPAYKQDPLLCREYLLFFNNRSLALLMT